MFIQEGGERSIVMAPAATSLLNQETVSSNFGKKHTHILSLSLSLTLTLTHTHTHTHTHTLLSPNYAYVRPIPILSIFHAETIREPGDESMQSLNLIIMVHT